MQSKSLTLRFYMKSGNVITIPNVDSWAYNNDGVALDITLHPTANAVEGEWPVLPSFDLRQIEAITHETIKHGVSPVAV